MKIQRKHIKLAFIVYCIVLFVFVIVKFDGINGMISTIKSGLYNREMGNLKINLVPFFTLSDQLGRISQFWVIRNLVGNTLVFAPFGFLLPVLFPKMKSFFQFFAVSVAFVIGKELFQLVTMLGSLDVDDIMLNMLGIIFGFVLYVVCKKVNYRLSRKIQIND